MSNYAEELFSGEQIAVALDQLEDYDRLETAASLENGTWDVGVIQAFAMLAKTIGAPVSAEYGGLKIKKLAALDSRRRAAIRNLQAAAERGEVRPAYLKPDEDENDVERKLNG